MRLASTALRAVATSLLLTPAVEAQPANPTPFQQRVLEAMQGEIRTPEERARLDNFQKLAKTDFDIDTLAPLGPAELAAALAADTKRRRVIDALTDLARTDGETQPGEQRLIEAYERAFGAASK